MGSDIDFFRIETNHVKPQKGLVLIAEPFLNDVYFKRAIVYITEHNAEGSVGFVINKPVDMDISDILADFPVLGAHFSIGGPVGTNTVHFLHTLGSLIPNSIHVSDNIFWGGDYDVLKEMAKAKAINKDQVRFFLGYSGWMPNQLENELEQNSWLVAQINSSSLMQGPSADSWTEILQSMGSRYKMWINSPENPGLN